MCYGVSASRRTGRQGGPPTYDGGKYATEDRRIDGEIVPCVLLDSVQSQANRMEMALLDAWEKGRIPLPVIAVDFAGNDMPKVLRITSLEAPHRIADALLRDSLLDGKRFRESEKGQQLDQVDNRNATPLLELCPTALVFGMWDSTGPRGGLGAKFARVLVSETVGIQAVPGIKTSSRIDPAQISSHVTIYHRNDSDAGMNWTSDPDDPMVLKDKKGQPIPYNRSGSAQGKPGNPSKANHSNIPPTKAAGGFTIGKAVQVTVLFFARITTTPVSDWREGGPEGGRCGKDSACCFGSVRRGVVSRTGMRSSLPVPTGARGRPPMGTDWQTR